MSKNKPKDKKNDATALYILYNNLEFKSSMKLKRGM